MTGWDADHRHPPALPTADHDPRTPDDFARDLWRATDASLRRTNDATAPATWIEPGTGYA